MSHFIVVSRTHKVMYIINLEADGIRRFVLAQYDASHNISIKNKDVQSRHEYYWDATHVKKGKNG